MSEKNVSNNSGCMSKEQFKLQALHNRYMRSTITSICKIILWTIICGFIVGLIIDISAAIKTSMAKQAITSAASSITSSYSSYSSGKSSSSDNSDNAASDLGSVDAVEGALILICGIVYSILVIREISSKITYHKDLSELEDRYLGLDAGTALGKPKAKKEDITERRTLVQEEDEEDDL